MLTALEMVELSKLKLYIKKQIIDNSPDSSKKILPSSKSRDIHLRYLTEIQININRAIELTRLILIKPQQ